MIMHMLQFVHMYNATATETIEQNVADMLSRERVVLTDKPSTKTNGHNRRQSTVERANSSDDDNDGVLLVQQLPPQQLPPVNGTTHKGNNQLKHNDEDDDSELSVSARDVLDASNNAPSWLNNSTVSHTNDSSTCSAQISLADNGTYNVQCVARKQLLSAQSLEVCSWVMRSSIVLCS
jgi:hypothetical protein